VFFISNFRPALAGMLEREVRREKFLEVRHRENRLKKRDADKKEADKKRIMDEENARYTAAGFPDITGMDEFEAYRVKIRHHVATNEALKGERNFFNSLRDVSFCPHAEIVCKLICELTFSIFY